MGKNRKIETTGEREGKGEKGNYCIVCMGTKLEEKQIYRKGVWQMKKKWTKTGKKGEQSGQIRDKSGKTGGQKQNRGTKKLKRGEMQKKNSILIV